MRKRGFVLIGSIFLVLFLGIFLSISLLRSHIQLQAMDIRRASFYAFYAAESGIDISIAELRRSPEWSSGFVDQQLIWESGGQNEPIGWFNVRLAPGAILGSVPTVWLESIGQDFDKRVSRTIVVRTTVENPANFFTSTIGDLVLGSGAAIGTPTDPAKLLARDVIFETDAALPDGDPSKVIAINGDVEYIRSLSGQTDPNVLINGNLIKRDPITFAGVDLERYQALADPAQGGSGRYITAGEVPAGGFVIPPATGNIDWANLGTNNGLIFVDGDVRITGTVTQSVHIVASGNIYIDGDIQCVDGNGDGIQEQIGLSASGDVIIPPSAPYNLNVDAMVLADGGVFIAESGGAPKGTLNFEGVISVRGKSSERSGINLNVYTSRNYTYDSYLNNSAQIPFLSAIVNIVNWKEEKDPNAAFPPP